MTEISVGGARIRLVQGDITRVPVDVIVNAANSELVGGGGVDGAIHRAGGPEIMLELNRIRPKHGCSTGGAVITGAGNLPARFVVHAVGPVWRGGGFQEALDLEAAYQKSLELAAGKGAAAVSFPSISTGAYGYPVSRAASVALAAVAGFLRRQGTAGPEGAGRSPLAGGGKTRGGTIREVVFVLFDEGTFKAYEKALAAVEPG